MGGLIRGIEQFERNRVKGEQLTGDDPQNSVARAIGGNRWRMTAAGIARRRFPRSTEQSPGQWKSHERRSAGGEVQGVVPVGGRTEQHVVADARFKNDLLKNLTVVRREHSQPVPIKNVNDALLAAGDQFMGIGAVLIGKDEGSGGTKAKTVGVRD